MIWMIYTLMFFMFVCAIASAINLAHSGRSTFGIDFIRLVIFVAAFLCMYYMVK